MSTARLSLLPAVILGIIVGAAGYAHAGKVTVQNNSGYEVYFAFVFYDYQKDDFYIRGWYSVPAGESKSWNFNIAPDRKFYWYGKTYDNKRRWPANGDHEQAVIYKAMNMRSRAVKTYADAKNVMFATRSTDVEGNITIKIK